jgi:hypothetical protein
VLALPLAVMLVAPVPSAFIVQISSAFVGGAGRENAIFEPSGDQLGPLWISVAANTRVRPVPSRLTVQRPSVESAKPVMR